MFSKALRYQPRMPRKYFHMTPCTPCFWRCLLRPSHLMHAFNTHNFKNKLIYYIYTYIYTPLCSAFTRKIFKVDPPYLRTRVGIAFELLSQHQQIGMYALPGTRFCVPMYTIVLCMRLATFSTMFLHTSAYASYSLVVSLTCKGHL